MSVRAWHFTGETLRDGRSIPEPGVWLEHTGPIVWCRSGLYASRRLLDALGNAPGATLHRVECDGIEREEPDKFVCRRRMILATIPGEAYEPILRLLARHAVLVVLPRWDAPEVVRRWLETGDESLRSAANSAADASTAYAAVYAAAYSAAYAAKYSSANAAAYSAANSAVYSAANSAAYSSANSAAYSAVYAAAYSALNEVLEGWTYEIIGGDMR